MLPLGGATVLPSQCQWEQWEWRLLSIYYALCPGHAHFALVFSIGTSSRGGGRRGSRGGVRGVRTPPLVIKVLHFYCKTALSQRQSLRRCPLRMPFEKTLNPPLQEILDPRLGGVIIPVPPPPAPPLEHYSIAYRVWLACLYHGSLYQGIFSPITAR